MSQNTDIDHAYKFVIILILLQDIKLMCDSSVLAIIVFAVSVRCMLYLPLTPCSVLPLPSLHDIKQIVIGFSIIMSVVHLGTCYTYH